MTMDIYGGVYTFFSEIFFPNGHKFTYCKDIRISFTKPNKGYRTLIIDKVAAEYINGELSQDFDFVMSWLGNVLYPLNIEISPTGTPKSIVNFNEVWKRYSDEGQRIMAHYEQAPLIVQYVETCLERVRDEKLFLQHIGQSNIYQLMVLCMDISGHSYQLSDFPFTRDSLTFQFVIEDENETELLLTVPEIKTERKLLSHESRAYVHKTGMGTFDHIQFILIVELEGDGYYTRRLELKRIKE